MEAKGDFVGFVRGVIVVAVVVGWLVGLVGCIASVDEKYYVKAYDPETKKTNYFRISVNGYSWLSKTKFSVGFYDRDAVWRLFGENAISREFQATQVQLYDDKDVKKLISIEEKLYAARSADENALIDRLIFVNASIEELIGKYQVVLKVRKKLDPVIRDNLLNNLKEAEEFRKDGFKALQAAMEAQTAKRKKTVAEEVLTSATEADQQAKGALDTATSEKAKTEKAFKAAKDADDQAGGVSATALLEKSKTGAALTKATETYNNATDDKKAEAKKALEATKKADEKANDDLKKAISEKDKTAKALELPQKADRKADDDLETANKEKVKTKGALEAAKNALFTAKNNEIEASKSISVNLGTAMAKLRKAHAIMLAIRIAADSRILVRFFDGAGNEIDVTTRSMVIFVSADISRFAQAIQSLAEENENSRLIVSSVLGPKMQEAQALKAQVSASDDEFNALSQRLDDQCEQFKSVKDDKEETKKFINETAQIISGKIKFEKADDIRDVARGMEASK